MKLNNSFLKQLFEEAELDNLKRAVTADENILPAIVTLLKYRASQTKSRPDMLESQNYPYKRAFYDGRAYECEWLINLLTGEENGGQDDSLGNRP